MRAPRLPALAGPIFGVLAALAMAPAMAQTPYPDLTIQDVDWTSGAHHYAVTQRILSPSTPDLPVVISESADAEFVSAASVRLLPGFHAGDFSSSTSGRFRARIDDALGEPGDVVIISPAPDGSSPYGSIVDNVIHVHKWEKVEIGVRLPQEYEEAIDRFFASYYTNGETAYSTPGNVDAVHDLNPYADDSLQLVMTLTDPSGDARMKWGFFMREGGWTGNADNDLLTAADPALNPLVPYDIRYRFAPDEEGAWQFSLSIAAPLTFDLSNVLLPEVLYSGYSFICDPPLPGNNGHLQVNEINRRTLQFQGDPEIQGDETPFFGLGTNLGLHRLKDTPNYDEFKLHQRDLRFMTESMEHLHEVGANFVRSYLLNLSFAPERVNLGVYDAFKVPQVCNTNFPSICANGGWTHQQTGNCQYQSWAFDQLLETAHTNNIYIQLCVDPYPPGVDYERFLWGEHPHVAAYLEPYRDTPANGNPWDLKRYLYSNVDPNNTESARQYDRGAFYYWKRKYKYIMNRWGYSVNIPIIEPFNEIDQMLSYSDHDCSPDLTASDPCLNNGALCQENRVPWVEDSLLRTAVSDWFSDIADYVRGDVDWNDPAHSPLGESNKLFLASYAGGDPDDPDAAAYYAPFSNPDVDIIDAHKGLHNPWDLSAYNGVVDAYRDDFTSNGLKKPFNSGEFTHYAKEVYNNVEYDLSPFFHNYEIAFHNELWSSAFSGKFAAGTSWQWGRVFWWMDSQKPAPVDGANNFFWSPTQQFANEEGEWNRLRVNNANYWVENRSAYHNFKPLTDLLNHPSWLAYDFFNGDYKVRQNSDFTDFEAYYLQNGAPNELSTVAIGWVRNRNSSIFNSFYLASSVQQFLSCTPPNPGTSDYLLLPMFEPGTYFVSWFPTRWNSPTLPSDGPVTTSFSGTIALDLQGQFGGIDNDFLDTLRGDYAFIITPDLFAKSLPLQPKADATLEADWDFTIHPNPAREGFTLRFQDDAPKEAVILDLSGRLIVQKAGIAASIIQFPELNLAQGAYWVRVSDGVHHETKKLIVQ